MRRCQLHRPFLLWRHDINDVSDPQHRLQSTSNFLTVGVLDICNFNNPSSSLNRQCPRHFHTLLQEKVQLCFQLLSKQVSWFFFDIYKDLNMISLLLIYKKNINIFIKYINVVFFLYCTKFKYEFSAFNINQKLINIFIKYIKVVFLIMLNPFVWRNNQALSFFMLRKVILPYWTTQLDMGILSF